MIFQNLAIKFTKDTFIKILKNIFDDDFIQKSIIDLIQNRIFAKGVDNENNQLKTDNSKLRIGNKSNFYSDYTVSIKSKKGQRIQNVTLKDTGEFYNSWYVEINNDFWNIKANFKDIFENFELSYSNQNDFEEKITSMNDKELNFIIQSRIIPRFQTELRNELQKV